MLTCLSHPSSPTPPPSLLHTEKCHRNVIQRPAVLLCTPLLSQPFPQTSVCTSNLLLSFHSDNIQCGWTGAEESSSYKCNQAWRDIFGTIIYGQAVSKQLIHMDSEYFKWFQDPFRFINTPHLSFLSNSKLTHMILKGLREKYSAYTTVWRQILCNVLKQWVNTAITVLKIKKIECY